MATPTCQQLGKGTPLTVTREDDSSMSTVVDSSTKEEPVGLGAGLSDISAEKIQNTVFWRPKEKVPCPVYLDLCTLTYVP